MKFVLAYCSNVVLEWKVCSANNNKLTMKKELIIKEGNIFFQEEIQFYPCLSLKLCDHQEIYKFHDFEWSSACRRWERKEPLRIPWPQQDELALEIYAQNGTAPPTVLAEGAISIPTLLNYLSREIRITLTYDGTYAGCLYCVVSDQEEEDHELSKHFLYVHKIEVTLLDDIPHGFKLQMLKNEQPVFEKEFHLHQKGKILFPNIKVPVKMSDVLTVDITHKNLKIKAIKFVADSIKRGKTSTYQVWLRNLIKNKVGDLKIEYFMQNLYLQNERQIFTRNGILARKILPVLPLTEQEKERVRRSVIIRQIVEADKRIMKIDHSMKRLIKNIEAKEKQSMHQSAPPNLEKQNSNRNHKDKSRKLQNKKSLRFESFD